MSNTTRTLGIVAIEPKGEYDATAYYEKLNTVIYNDSTYMALRSSTGVLPTDTDYWQLIGGGVRREDIVDNLDSNDNTKMLSAKQGKILNEGKVQVFDKVADMKAANLKEGMTVQTLGYYEANDGGHGEYIIVDDDTLVDDAGSIHVLDNGLRAKLIIDYSNINAKTFGIKSDGVNNDSTAIQNAINTACKYIKTRTSLTDSFGGPIKINLPNTKIYIKSRIETNEAIVIEGSGTNTTLVLANDIDYMIKFKKDSNTKSRNEETQIEGAGIKNLRFDGLSRSHTCTSAIYVGYTDHFILENLYFMCIKGKCIELQAAREGLINNIFTRFCGVYGVGNIDIIPNSNVGGDTSNLIIGNNWNLIYPFGNAIKFDTGEVQYINNVVIHGMFDAIINSLENYFGTNDYIDTNNHFIELNKSNPNFMNLDTIYCPNNSYNINITDCNNVIVTNAWLRGKKTNNEAHGDGKYNINLSTNSNLYLNNVRCTMAYQDGDIFNVDSTSKVYGSIINTGSSYLNSSVEDFKRATNFTIEGEKAQPVRLGYGKAINYKTYNRDCRANMILGQSDPEDILQTIQPDALYIGTNVYRTRAVVGIPDDAYFVLPTVTGTMSYINHSIFFDTDGNLKVNIYDQATQGFVTKTIQMQ